MGNLENLDLGLSQDQNQSEPTGNQDTDAFVNEFLKNVAPEDLPHVEKYYKDWGGNVTRKFQEYSEKLKPWEELGVDYDNARNAIYAMQLADQDPVGFYNQIKNYLEREGLMPGEQEMSGVPPQLPEYEGLPDEFVSEYSTMKQELEQLRGFADEIKEERKRGSQQQQLDNLMQELETKHGKFDQPAVMGRILQGMEPEAAVKDFQKMIKSLNNPEPRPTPPNVLGSGRAVRDQVDAKEIRNDPAKRKELVAQLLEGIGQ
jgi:hypothetical protein